MNMRDNRTRAERERDKIWAWVRVLGMIVLGVLVALLVIGAEDDMPEPPSVEVYRARAAAQERYYEAVDRYGDVEGATQAAELVYRDLMEEVET